MAWRSGNRDPFKKIVKVAWCFCERCCARLAGAVKSNSSQKRGLERFKILIFLKVKLLIGVLVGELHT
jgi:hypothetical protein